MNTMVYTGFSLRTEGNILPSVVCFPTDIPDRFGGEHPSAIQWGFSREHEPLVPLPPTPEGQLFLAVLLWQSLDQHRVQRIADALVGSRYQELTFLGENVSGCFLHHDGSLFLWVGLASKAAIFLRTDQGRIHVSTNPLDLVSDAADLDQWALRRCCHGDDVFVFDLQRVEQGHLVTIHTRCPDATQSRPFDHFHPEPRLQGNLINQELAVSLTQDALCASLQPLMRMPQVGLLLSGGAGSVALLAAMKRMGIHVMAYHMESPDPAGSEYQYARLACDALHVPLTRILMSTGPDYLSSQWIFPHPYGHPWARWYEQLCQQAQRDGISLLVTGGGDDSAFGPGQTYGVHSVLSAPLTWREKGQMLKAMVATDWNIFDLLKSLHPSYQLIGPSSLSGTRKEDRIMRRADFLTPLAIQSRPRDDIALQHAPCFTPQALALDQAIFQPNRMQLFNPYHQRAIQAISLTLPDAYKLMPNLFAHDTPYAQLIDKPILRLTCKDVPPEVAWRIWSVWTQAPGQHFCLTQKEHLQRILGSGSCLADLGIVDLGRLHQVLSHQATLRANYKTLIMSSMVELFLKHAWSPRLERGGLR